VGIDQARQHRQLRKVVGGACVLITDPPNTRAIDGDDDVALNTAAPVDERSGPDRDLLSG